MIFFDGIEFISIFAFDINIHNYYHEKNLYLYLCYRIEP